MEQAITREKQIKKWNRAWKIQFIEQTNPEWRDLVEDMETLRQWIPDLVRFAHE